MDAAVRGAGAGLGSDCAIARVGERGSVGDVGMSRVVCDLTSVQARKAVQKRYGGSGWLV